MVIKMGIIKGLPVTLVEHVETGKDPFGAPITEERETVVNNVLIAPITADDVESSTNLTGVTAVYKLGIPKGDTHDWRGAEVRFFGDRFRVIGEPIQGIESMIPLEWNKTVKVGKYE